MVSSQWCGGGGEAWFDSYGPSECLCYTSVVLVPSSLLVLYLAIKYRFGLSQNADQKFYASLSLRFLYTTVVLFLANPVLFSVVAFAGSSGDDDIFLAKIIGVAINIVAWAMCAFSIYYDFHCQAPWPCAGIKYYLFVEVFAHAVTISSIYSAEHNTTKLIMGCVSFLVTLFLLVVALYKEKFRMLFERRYRLSDDKLFTDDAFNDADSFTSANISVSFQDNRQSWFSKHSRSFFSFNEPSVDSQAEEGLLGRDSLLSESSFYSGHYRDSDLSNTTLPWRTRAHEEEATVESIMERNLQSTPTDHEDLERSTLSPDKPLSEGFPPSSALARAMRNSSRSANAMNKSSSGMVGSLAPKGQVPRQQLPGGVGMGMRAKDLQSSDTGSAQSRLDNLQIRMGKYGFRREHDMYSMTSRKDETTIVSNDSDYPTRLSSFDTSQNTEVGPDGSINRPKVLLEKVLDTSLFNATQNDRDVDDTEPECDVGNVMMEVEFQILFNLNDNGSDVGWMDATGEIDSIQSEGVPQQWSVWRTGKEVLALHAVLVGKFGDLAPRRPKLAIVGPQQESASFSREAIISDTRVIGGYLRALVAMSLFHCPEFCTFCEIPMALVPPPKLETKDSLVIPPTTLSREASTNLDDSKDQWRLIYHNLRKNLKPQEIAARCRVYDGVVLGKDISKWLLTSSYNYALDYTEAHRIAQGLLEAELLIPVCAGYDHTLQLQPDPSDQVSGVASVNTQCIVSDKETLNTFKSHPSYIYRYPGRSGTNSGIGAFSMFAHRVDVTIPTWFQADRDDNTATNVINYTVRSCMLDEQWEVLRRFNEFSQFHKAIQREGIKPSEAFPTTSFSKLLIGQVSSGSNASTEAKIKERVAALELYLCSAIEAIMIAVRDMPGDSYSDMSIYSESSSHPKRHRLLTLLAQFLDDEHSHLRLCCPIVGADSSPPSTQNHSIEID